MRTSSLTLGGEHRACLSSHHKVFVEPMCMALRFCVKGVHNKAVSTKFKGNVSRCTGGILRGVPVPMHVPISSLASFVVHWGALARQACTGHLLGAIALP